MVMSSSRSISWSLRTRFGRGMVVDSMGLLGVRLIHHMVGRFCFGTGSSMHDCEP